jgi:predicted nuclease with TOPRIM domain
MVSGRETIPSRLFMTSSEPTKEEILERLAALEEENEKLREENKKLREENKRLRAKLRWYEGPHTPPSKVRIGLLCRRQIPFINPVGRESILVWQDSAIPSSISEAFD